MGRSWSNKGDTDGITPREWTLNVSAVAVFIWLFRVAELALPALHNPAGMTMSTDDAMRLAEVRDLIAGQSWFDLTQWRMNVPWGLPMHWSRLIDAPIAGIILLMRHFVGSHWAEIVAICMWPLVPLLGAWLAIGRIATHLADKKGGVIAVLLAAGAIVVLGYFLPGVIDHHNVQVALTLWAIVFVIEFAMYSSAAIGAAIVTVLSLAIGLEVLPYAVTTVLIVATLWVLRGAEIAPAVRRFGLTFAAASLVVLAGFTASHERFSAACDMFSGFYVTLAVVGGLALSAVTLVPVGTRPLLVRTVMVVGVGVSLVLLTSLIAPACFAGPYANVTPLIGQIFLARVQEVQSPVLNAATDWSFFFYGYIYAALGLAGCAFAVYLAPTERRTLAIVLCAFAAMSFAVMSIEVRGILFAVLVGLPGLAASMQLAIDRWATPGWRAALVTIAALAICNDISFAYAAAAGRSFTETEAQASARAQADSLSWYCFGQPSVAQLARQPRGRVAAFLDQGPAILAYSGHSVIAGPYHRNEQGILDTFNLFTKPPTVGAQIALRRGLDYVVVCRTSYDFNYYLQNSGNEGLLGRIAAHQIPAWLEPIPSVGSHGRVTIYRVLRAQLQTAAKHVTPS